MKKRVLKALAAIRDEIESWGLSLPEARGTGPKVRLFLLAPEGRQLIIGTLSQDNGEFVFRYDDSFRARADAAPLGAFPEFNTEYRARHLFPFFAARLPPTDREDVRQLLIEHDIKPDDTMRVLGVLSQRTIANPYRLELVPLT